VDALARLLIVIGFITVGFGLILLAAARLPFLGRLPGDIHIKTDGVSIYFPLVTMLIVSLVLTIVLNVVIRLFFR
jgi:hypothetical protein